jgi:group I intron endonuclease
MDDEAQSSNTENIETSVEFVNLIDDIQEIKIDTENNLPPIIYQGYIYELVNMENKKHYVGMSTRHYDTRIEEHLRGSGSKKIKEEIKRYGKQAFIKNVLEVITKHSLLDLTQELFLREAFWIKEKDTFINGYNSNQGSTFRNRDSLLNYIYRGDLKVLGEKINDRKTTTKATPIKEEDSIIEHSPPLKKIKLEKLDTEPETSGEDVIDIDDSSQECPNNEPDNDISTFDPNISNLSNLPKILHQILEFVKDEKGFSLKNINTHKSLETSLVMLRKLLEEVDNLKTVADKRLEETSVTDMFINIMLHSTTVYKKGGRCNLGKFALNVAKELNTFRSKRTTIPIIFRDIYCLDIIQEFMKLQIERSDDIISKNYTSAKRQFANLLHQWEILDKPNKSRGNGGTGICIHNRVFRENYLLENVLDTILLHKN